jgi:hypothetical protein
MGAPLGTAILGPILAVALLPGTRPSPPGTGNRAARDIPLPRYVLKAIDKHLASHGTTDDGYLFRAGQLGRGTPGAAAQGRRQALR